jgi:hypothetical protein
VVGEEAKKNFSQYVVRKIGDENGFCCHGGVEVQWFSAGGVWVDSFGKER